ncbi:hypothetical protein EYR40_000802 [Pleurotus pulmonarius]|nr:hypothetical protein EYR40_000802 [Pleurotus pulmonarius]
MITLWTPSSTVSSDDAGISIKKTTLPPVPRRFPYPDPTTTRYKYVPSLSLLCILRVYTAPDQLHLLGGLRLNYMVAEDRGSFDLLRALIPGFRPAEYTSTQLDPRLWATLIQIYDELPDCLRTYNIPLSDEHLPLLQYVQSTPTFTLITILNLAKCNLLTDANIISLKPLSTLAALDASYTSLSDYGVKSLAGTIVWSDDDQIYRGPSSLRVLKIRGCSKVTNNIYASLFKLPLLCLVDLRNTMYTSSDYSSFRLSQNSSLFDSALPVILSKLSQPGFYSSQNVYTIYVDRREHPSASVFGLNGALPSSKFPSQRMDTVQTGPSPDTMCSPFDYNEENIDMSDDNEDKHSAVERYALNILNEEAQLQAAREKATNFYRRGVNRKRDTPTTNPQHTGNGKGRRNECMLIRHPPPWHLLNASTTRALFSPTSNPSTLIKGHEKPSGFISPKPAAINVKKAMKAKQALMDWEAQRRTLHSLRSTSIHQERSAITGSSSASTSRNPFARRFGDDGDGSSPAPGSRQSPLPADPSNSFASVRSMLGPNRAPETSSKNSSLPPSDSNNKMLLKKAPLPKVLARSSSSKARQTSTTSTSTFPGIKLKPVTTLSVPLPPPVNDVNPSKARKGTVAREIATPGIPKGLSLSEENGHRTSKGKGTDLHAEMDTTLARYSRRSSLPACVGHEDKLCSAADGPVKRLIIKADDPPPAQPMKRAKKETSSSSSKAKKTASRRESTQFDWKVWGMR